MDPLGLITAGVSAGGQLLNYFSNRETNSTNEDINERNIQANFELAKSAADYNHDEAVLARQWQEDMYNRYQSPSAQVEQLRRAGLNPALVYGEGSAGSFSGAQGHTSSSSVPSSIPMQSYQVDSNAISSSIKQAYDSLVASKQADLLEEQARGAAINNSYIADKMIADIALTRQKSNLTERESKVLDDTVAYLAATQRARVDEKMYQSSGARANVELTERNAMYLNERIQSEQLQRKLSLQENSRQWQKLYSDIEAAKAMVAKLNSDVSVNDAQVRRIGADIAESIERATGMHLDNSVKSQINDFVVEQARGKNDEWRLQHKLRVDPVWLGFNEFWSKLTSIIPFANGYKDPLLHGMP